jgi:flagellar basal-body rod modification protein FlgD
MSMMGVKAGTKAFSNATQNEISGGSVGPKTNSAQDLAKFGDENIGDVLNKIADPNWVDPSKKIRTTGDDKMGKDSFMKMMIAQMKHQDPTNPMQSHELAAQLAQFSSVEQLQNVNQSLDEMKAGQKPTESFQALNFIGKAVSGDSSKLVRVKGDKTHDFSYTLGGDAKEAKFKVRNSAGEIIRTVDLKELKQGANSFTWNGMDDRGSAAPAGEYQFFLEATAANGQKLGVKTDFEGIISGLNYTPEGPVLLVGTQSVKLKDVKKIVDPSLMKNGQISQNTKLTPGQDLLKQQSASQNGEKADEEQRAGDPVQPPASNVMDSVGMSRDLMARLEKETRPDSSQKK